MDDRGGWLPPTPSRSPAFRAAMARFLSAFLSTSLAKVPMLRNAILSVAFMMVLTEVSTINRKALEVTKIASEFPKMSTTAEFVQSALQDHIAPKSLGSVKVRLPYAQSVLRRRGWTANRVRDFWYRDDRASAPTWEEIDDLEQLTGLKYARQELRTNDQLISQADALLQGVDEDFHRPFVAAFRAFFGAIYSTRVEGRDE